MHTDSGLGRDEKGWPIATADWWDRNTKGHSDWKKLKYGSPDYLSLLEQIFEGVAVDDDDDDDDVYEIPKQSPMTSGSHKRASSTSTTATSPIKKSKSPMIKMMKDFLTVSSKQAEE